MAKAESRAIGTKQVDESTSAITPVASASMADLCRYGELVEVFAEAIDTEHAATDSRIERLRTALYQAHFDTSEVTDDDLRELLFRGSGYVERVLEMSFRRRDLLSEEIAARQVERDELDPETDADQIEALEAEIESLRDDRDESWDLAMKLQSIARVDEEEYVQ